MELKCDSPDAFFGPVYPSGSTLQYITWAATAVSVILFFFSFVFLLRRNPREGMKATTGVVLGLWVILPPAWFAIEYFVLNSAALRQYWHLGVLPCPETFKYSQDLTSKVWVAAVALLLTAYQKKVPGVKE